MTVKEMSLSSPESQARALDPVSDDQNKKDDFFNDLACKLSSRLEEPLCEVKKLLNGENVTPLDFLKALKPLCENNRFIEGASGLHAERLDSSDIERLCEFAKVNVKTCEKILGLATCDADFEEFIKSSTKEEVDLAIQFYSLHSPHGIHVKPEDIEKQRESIIEDFFRELANKSSDRSKVVVAKRLLDGGNVGLLDFLKVLQPLCENNSEVDWEDAEQLCKFAGKDATICKKIIGLATCNLGERENVITNFIMKSEEEEIDIAIEFYSQISGLSFMSSYPQFSYPSVSLSQHIYQQIHLALTGIREEEDRNNRMAFIKPVLEGRPKDAIEFLKSVKSKVYSMKLIVSLYEYCMEWTKKVPSDQKKIARQFLELIKSEEIRGLSIEHVRLLRSCFYTFSVNSGAIEFLEGIDLNQVSTKEFERVIEKCVEDKDYEKAKVVLSHLRRLSAEKTSEFSKKIILHAIEVIDEERNVELMEALLDWIDEKEICLSGDEFVNMLSKGFGFIDEMEGASREQRRLNLTPEEAFYLESKNRSDLIPEEAEYLTLEEKINGIKETIRKLLSVFGLKYEDADFLEKIVYSEDDDDYCLMQNKAAFTEDSEYSVLALELAKRWWANRFEKMDDERKAKFQEIVEKIDEELTSKRLKN